MGQTEPTAAAAHAQPGIVFPPAATPTAVSSIAVASPEAAPLTVTVTVAVLGLVHTPAVGAAPLSITSLADVEPPTRCTAPPAPAMALVDRVVELTHKNRTES